MICVQCGTENVEQAKYCSKCSALLFQVAPEGVPTSSLDLGESIALPQLESHYQSPLLESLAWAVHEFIEEEGEFEPIVEAYEAYREVYDKFEKELPQLQELRYATEVALEGDPGPKYMKFLLDRAVEYYHKGESLFESYLELLEGLEDDEGFPDPEPLKDGTRAWVDCNDNICMAYELLEGQMKEVDFLAAELEQILQEEASDDDSEDDAEDEPDGDSGLEETVATVEDAV